MQLHCAPIKGHGNGQPALDDRPPGDGGSPETPREARGKGVTMRGRGQGRFSHLATRRPSMPSTRPSSIRWWRTRARQQRSTPTTGPVRHVPERACLGLLLRSDEAQAARPPAPLTADSICIMRDARATMLQPGPVPGRAAEFTSLRLPGTRGNIIVRSCPARGPCPPREGGAR